MIKKSLFLVMFICVGIFAEKQKFTNFAEKDRGERNVFGGTGKVFWREVGNGEEVNSDDALYPMFRFLRCYLYTVGRATENLAIEIREDDQRMFVCGRNQELIDDYLNRSRIVEQAMYREDGAQLKAQGAIRFWSLGCIVTYDQEFGARVRDEEVGYRVHEMLKKGEFGELVGRGYKVKIGRLSEIEDMKSGDLNLKMKKMARNNLK